MLVLQLRETRTPQADLGYCLVLDVGSSYQRFSAMFEGGLVEKAASQTNGRAG